MIDRIPGDVVAISESGLRAADDVLRLRDRGYRAFLIGERFMTADEPGAALRALLQGCRETSANRTPRRTGADG